MADPPEAPRTTAPRTTLGVLFTILLAALAGWTDAFGLLRLGHLFVSFMSGNSTHFVVAVARGEMAEAGKAISVVLLFVAGSALGTVIARLSGTRHLPAVLLAVAAMLGLAASGVVPILLMTLGMGALNAALNRAGDVSVSITYVTGTLVHVGAGLGNLLFGETGNWGWVIQGMSWVGLVLGGFCGALAETRLGWGALWIGAVLAAALSLATALLPRRVRPS